MTKKKRHAFDFYRTPAWTVHRLLEKIEGEPAHVHGALCPEYVFGKLHGPRWFEPCAGDGAIVAAVDSWMLERKRAPVRWRRNDVRANLGNDLAYSFDDPALDRDYARCDLAISNPPYSRTVDVLLHLLERRTPFAMLLRLAIAKEWGRRLERKAKPDIYVLPDRPSFTGRGTDPTEYAWFVSHKTAIGRFDVLERTPRDVIMAERVIARTLAARELAIASGQLEIEDLPILRGVEI